MQVNYEYEIRRRGPLTPAVVKGLHKLKLVETHFIIYWNDLRAIINCDNPRIEKKTLLETKPIFLNLTTIEICYKSQEETVSMLVLYDMLKNGIIVKKNVYMKKDGFILYTLENMELDINGGHQNKCLIELENPSSTNDSLKNLYLETSFVFNLNIDDRFLVSSVENVLHNSFIPVLQEQRFPKVDGERGLVNFYTNYETFTSNTISFILKPSLYKLWGKKYSFLFKNVTFIAELVGSRLVFIDLAHSKHFGASTRIEFIEHLGREIRKIHSPDGGILFQSIDMEYIKSNINTDGSIYINNDKLYKEKNIPTVDLKFAMGKMIDRNGICYKLCVPYKNLVVSSIYECLLNEDQCVVEVLRPRHDKYFPNTRMVVLSILNSFKKV